MSESESSESDHLEFMTLSAFNDTQDSTLDIAHHVPSENDMDYLQKCMDSLESKDSGVHLSSKPMETSNSNSNFASLKRLQNSGTDINFINMESMFVESSDNVASEEQFNLLENEISLIEQDYASSSDLNINAEQHFHKNEIILENIEPSKEFNSISMKDLIIEKQKESDLNPDASQAKLKIRDKILKNCEKHKTYVNKCTECSMIFRYKRHYDRHMEGHKKNNCIHCDAKFARWKHLDVHLFRIHGETSHRYIHSCDVCMRSFPKKSLLHHHRSKHFYKEGKVCPECGEIVKNDAEFEEHKQKHDEEKLYKCSRCPRAFRIKQTYVIHIQNHDNYKCPACEDTFSSKKAVNEHFKLAHSMPKKNQKSAEDAGPYFCKDCRQVFVKKSSYCRHLETAMHFNKANEEVPLKAIFTCPICSKTLTSRQACVQHVRRVHKGEKKFVCGIHGCSFQCAYKNDLVRHKQLHVEERNVICEYCGKTFTSLSILKDHVLYVHNKERHFVCEECGKSFKRNSLLNRHKLSHQQIRPFSCQQCSAAFKRSHHLTRHMESCHRLTLERKKKVVKLMKTEDGNLVPVPEKLKKTRHKDEALPPKPNENVDDQELNATMTGSPSLLKDNDAFTSIQTTSLIESENIMKETINNSEADVPNSLQTDDAMSQVLSLVDVNSGQVVTLQVTDRDSSSMNALVDQFEANCNEMFGLTNYQGFELQSGILHMDQNYYSSEYYSELHLGNEDSSLLLDTDAGKIDMLTSMEHYPPSSLLSYLNV